MSHEAGTSGTEGRRCWEDRAGEALRGGRRSLFRAVGGASAGAEYPRVNGEWFGEGTGLQSSARAKHKEPGTLRVVCQWALAAVTTVDG